MKRSRVQESLRVEQIDTLCGIELGCELANLDYGYKNIGGLIEQWQKKQK